MRICHLLISFGMLLFASAPLAGQPQSSTPKEQDMAISTNFGAKAGFTAALSLLNDYRGSVCVESFDPFVVAWFRFRAPDLLRGQLSMPSKYYNMKKPWAFIFSHCLMNFIARPQFIAYRIGPRPLAVRFSELLGAMKVGWTSHEPRNEKGRDAVIFEFYKPRVSFK